MQDGRIHIEKVNGPFIYQLKGTPAEYKAGLDLAIGKGWLWLHESGTYVKITEATMMARIGMVRALSREEPVTGAAPADHSAIAALH